MPCSEEDSKDIPYLQAVFDFIESNPEQFDASKIYAQGFSQNSMFSAYIGFCFNEKVLAIWQGGSGMAYTGQPPNLPGCQAHVIFSVISYLYLSSLRLKLVRSETTVCAPTLASSEV